MCGGSRQLVFSEGFNFSNLQQHSSKCCHKARGARGGTCATSLLSTWGPKVAQKLLQATRCSQHVAFNMLKAACCLRQPLQRRTRGTGHSLLEKKRSRVYKTWKFCRVKSLPCLHVYGLSVCFWNQSGRITKHLEYKRGEFWDILGISEFWVHYIKIKEQKLCIPNYPWGKYNPANHWMITKELVGVRGCKKDLDNAFFYS